MLPGNAEHDMAKTPSQRQAAYRAKRATAGDNGERRLDTWISTAASLALDRLAKRDRVTKREIIEQLALAANERIVASLDPDSPAWGDYFKH